MQGYTARLDHILRELVSLEVSTHAGLPCPLCDSAIGIVRCSICDVNRLYCATCIVQKHGEHPFHRLEIWRQLRFVPISLSTLGYTYYLGHDGDRCPDMDTVDRHRVRKSKSPTKEPPASQAPRREVRESSILSDVTLLDDEDPIEKVPDGHLIQVAHTNGFHDLYVGYCGCVGAPDRFTQLLRARIFPGSVSQPRTAYTFAVLNLWHKSALEATINAYDFNKILCCLTDEDFPVEVKVNSTPPFPLYCATF